MTQHSHQTAPTQFVDAKGIRFAYRRFGKSSGVPLVFNMALVRGYGRRRNSIFDAVCYGCLFLRRTESGRPVASMRLRTAQPMATSVC